MLAFIIKRILSLVPVIFGMTLMVFLLVHIIPGDPVDQLLGNKASDEAKEAVRKELRLDEPIQVQYIAYMEKLISGNLGASLRTRVPIHEEIVPYLIATLELTLTSIIIALFIGVNLGIISAWKDRSMVDYAVMLATLFAVSTPLFWFAIIEQWVFAIQFKLLPSVGRLDAGESIQTITHLYVIDTIFAGRLDYLWSVIKHLILPTITLATIPTAIIARQTRSSLLEIMNSDYIRTAKAKGLTNFRVMYKHALKNALIPIVTLVGMMFGSLLGGAVLTEVIFAWPGVGRYIYQAISFRDYTVIQSGVLVISLIFMLVNLIVDLLYTVIDPRIKYD